jgi:large subunit ribosomal protein L23
MAAQLSVWDILRSPVVTEKSVLLKEASSGDDEAGQILTFRINTKARKDDVRRAVEEIFGVKVARIRTIQYEGKMKKRGRYEGRRASWKKAYVTLRKGEPFVDYAEAI